MPNSIPLVYIVEDDVAICKALEWLFASVKIDSQTFANGKELLEQYDKKWAGCILADIRMPEMGGIELQERLNNIKNHLPIIFMTGHGDITLAVRAMKAGAFDFITKPFNNQNLLDQIQKAIDFNLKHRNSRDKTFMEGYQKLTARESEILHCIVEGRLNKQMSHDLDISISTVEMHRANIMRKLGVKSIVDLIRLHTIHQDLILR